MGRQAYLASLALGRSPYQDPERDEHGNFILGPHAHDLDNHDHYVQDFDDRGHPRNRTTNTRNSALYRAQNDVLATVNIVRRKSDDAKTVWQKSTPKEKVDIILDENASGSLLLGLDIVTCALLEAWVRSLRRRILTFRSYSTVSLSTIIRSEWRIYGLATFFSAGLPIFVLPILQFPFDLAIRHVLNLFSPHAKDSEGDEIYTSDQDCVCRFCRFRRISVNSVSYIFWTPPYVYTLLQMLQLLPTSTFRAWNVFVPWSLTSPLRVSQLPANLTIREAITDGRNLLYHPLVLELVGDQLRDWIKRGLYKALVCKVDIPDNPDEMSRQAGVFEMSHELSAGGANKSIQLRSQRTKNIFTELRHQFWLIDQTSLLWSFLFTKRVGSDWQKPLLAIDNALSNGVPGEDIRPRWPHWSNDRPEPVMVERQRQATNDTPRGHEIPPPEDTEQSRLTTSGFMAIDTAPVYLGAENTADAGRLTPAMEPSLPGNPAGQRLRIHPSEHNLYDLASEFLDSEHNPLHPTRVPLPITPSEAESNPFDDPTSVAAGIVTEQGALRGPGTLGFEVDPDNSLPSGFADDFMPLNNGQLAISGLAVVSTDTTSATNLNEVTSHQHPEHDEEFYYERRSNVTGDPHAPIPSRDPSTGRRPSSAYYQEPPSSTYRSHRSNRRLERRMGLGPEMPASYYERKRWPKSSPKEHRITSVAVYPGISVAEQMADLLTTAIMLPFESFAMRALVMNFLAHPADRPGAVAACMGLQADVRPLFTLFGGREDGIRGRIRYAGLVLLTLGLQGLMKSVSWGIVSGTALWIGRQYGWGQL